MAVEELSGWWRGGPSTWFPRIVARPGFQKWAARVPFGRHLAKRDGAEIFRVLQGFVESQALVALIELNVLRRLLDGPATASELFAPAGISQERGAALLQAAAAMGFVVRRRSGVYSLARKGAAILGVPGLEDMILHNKAFYSDMGDPVALLRGEGETELAHFWPYVMGRGGDIPEDVSARYSDLMARSQDLVAQDTLRMVRLSGIKTLLDVGGGTGVFLTRALQASKSLRGVLFDLPSVRPMAEDAIGRVGLAHRLLIHEGDFRKDPFPDGVDAISLVRVLYDHDHGTVEYLLGKVFRALPPGGRLIVSEPMSGGRHPDRITDLYFSFYTMAMGTGSVRSAQTIRRMCEAAGFQDVRVPRAPRSFVTSVLIARKPL